MPPASAYPWRVGRRVGRTIYAQLGEEPVDTDPLIGVMDTPELAAEAVAGHNALLPRERRDARCEAINPDLSATDLPRCREPGTAWHEGRWLCAEHVAERGGA